MLTRSEQADRAARGLYASWVTQVGYVDGGETDERDGLLVTATRLPDDTLNVGFVTRPLADPEGTLAWCVAWFRERGLTPGVELRPKVHPDIENLLARNGFRVVVRRPAMALHPVPDLAPEPGRITVTAVESDADLASFQAIQADAFAMTSEVSAGFLPRRAVETPGVRFWLGWYDDVPAATAATTMSAHGAGVVGVATVPAYRRRGLGAAVTRRAVAWGREQGADLAWLYPSPMARPLYEGLGFAAVDDAAVWVLRS